MKYNVLPAVMLFGLMLLGAACRQPEQATQDSMTVPQPVVEDVMLGEPSPMPVPAPTPEPQPVITPVLSESEPEPQPVIRTFDITAKQWAFEPSTIRVNKGDTVVFNVTSVDVDHGLTLAQFGVDLKLKSGETKTATFVADKTGSFTFSCHVFCGSGHGSMKGTLIVE